MNPVTKEMERLGWSWNGTLQMYVVASGGVGFGIKYKDAEKEFNVGKLKEFVEESVRQHKRDLRRKKNEKV